MKDTELLTVMANHLNATVPELGTCFDKFPNQIMPSDTAGMKPCVVLELETADISAELVRMWTMTVWANLMYQQTTDSGMEFNVANSGVTPLVDAFSLDPDDTNIHTKIPALTGRVSRIMPTNVVYSLQVSYAGSMFASARVRLDIKFHRRTGESSP